MNSHNEEPLLTVVVPVSRMYGKLQNLFLWLNDIDKYECEVIIIHDKQDHNTSEELQRHLKELDSPKVTFLEGSFGSPGLARNFGKHYSTGTHIMFCDSDDVLHLSSAIEVIRMNSSPAIIIGRYEAVDSFSNHKVVKHLAPMNLLQLAKSPGIWRFIFKSEVVKNVNFTEYCMGEDQLFLAQIGMFSRDVLCVSETLYHYYTNNPNQLTAQKERIPDLIAVVNGLKELKKHFRGLNRTFIKLLILKNCLTVFKNSRRLNADSKRNVSNELTLLFVITTFTLNWNGVFRFGGRSR